MQGVRLKPIVYVLAAPRSGTTLLRVMLAGHPSLFAPPEMVLAPFATMAERAQHMRTRYWEKGGLRRALMELDGLDVDGARAAVDGLGSLTIPEVYAYLQERLGDRILVDKCPHLALGRDAMTRTLETCPEARYVWITRHPGSVIRSMQNMPMAEVMLTGYAGAAERLWQEANINIGDFLLNVPADRWTRIRYETLVAEPRPTMEAVAKTVGVPFDEMMLQPYEGDRMREGPKGARAVGDPNMAGRGKIDPALATAWLKGFDPSSVSDSTRKLALALGYDFTEIGLPPIAHVSESLDGLWESLTEIEGEMNLSNDLDAVEGRRFLLRILSASLDTFVENADTERPVFLHAEGPHRKMFADCPDTDYLRAPIDVRAGQSYRVWGKIPRGALYVGIMLYGRGGRVAAHLSDRDLTIDEEGRFEVLVSSQEQQRDWLRTDGDEQAVMVRQYFTDRSTQPPIEVHIEAVPRAASPPQPLDAETLRAAVDRSRRMVKTVVARTTNACRMATVDALNRFVDLPGEALFPTPDNTYRVAWYRFGRDQAMLVRGRLPAARYFSVALYNTWLETFDYRYHRCVLNHEQIQAASDGTFELCLADRDPGHPNWLDTAGHRAGYVIARMLLPTSATLPLETQIVYLNELPGR